MTKWTDRLTHSIPLYNLILVDGREKVFLVKIPHRVIRSSLTIQKSQQILDKADVFREGVMSDITRTTLASSSVTFDQ